jgi:hypothetical protein
MIYVIDLWMLSIYADTKWHLEMLYGNTVKIITPDDIMVLYAQLSLSL